MDTQNKQALLQRKSIREIIAGIFVFLCAIFLYVLLLVAMGYLGGDSDFTWLVTTLKVTFISFITIGDPLLFWMLVLWIGLPAAAANYLSKFFISRWILLILPLVAVAMSFLGGLIYMGVFSDKFSNDPYIPVYVVDAYFSLAVVFQAIFSFWLAVLRLRQRKKMGEIYVMEDVAAQMSRAKAKYIIALLLLIFLGIASLWVSDWLRLKSKQREIFRMAEEAERREKELQESRMADTYGGKTPQETLQMYIDAVEKGDYELASKYFILEEQEKELNNLRTSPPENIKKVNDLLKKSLYFVGSYSMDRRQYTIGQPILVDFVLYPSGVWKITEI